MWHNIWLYLSSDIRNNPKSEFMKHSLFTACMAFALLPAVACAQHTKGKPMRAGSSQTPGFMPSWATAHNYKNDKYVYFPDYYTFYSPQRGYIYYKDGGWTSSLNMPTFMSRKDVNVARAQILDNVPMNSYPERDFSTYLNQYPAQPAMGGGNPVPPVK